MTQSASNVQISIKRQSAKGVPAAGSGATGYDVFPSRGLKLNKGLIDNPVIRRDGQKKRKRHGSRSSGAAYKYPLSLGTLDPLLEAGLRGTWVASFDITEASVIGGSAAATSMTTTTNTIVLAAGSAITQGARKGMKVKIAGHSTAANNGKWLRLVNISADGRTLTVPNNSLTLNATPDTAFTLTFARYLTNPQTLIERYHTIEEFKQDMQKSILGTDMKICKIEFNAGPDSLIDITFTFMGLDAQGQAGPTAVLTNPTYSNTISLVMVDGTIRIGGVDYQIMTGMKWTWDMGGEVPKVMSPTGPDVILGQGELSGDFSALSEDLTFFNAFSAETPLDIFIDCLEPDLSDPKDFISFYFGNLTLSDNDTQLAQNGAMPETVPWNAGIDDVGGASSLTTMLISTSAA